MLTSWWCCSHESANCGKAKNPIYCNLADVWLLRLVGCWEEQQEIPVAARPQGEHLFSQQVPSLLVWLRRPLVVPVGPQVFSPGGVREGQNQMGVEPWDWTRFPNVVELVQLILQCTFFFSKKVHFPVSRLLIFASNSGSEYFQDCHRVVCFVKV